MAIGRVAPMGEPRNPVPIGRQSRQAARQRFAPGPLNEFHRQTLAAAGRHFQRQASRADAGARLQLGSAYPARLLDAVGLAARGRHPGHRDRPDELRRLRLFAQIPLGADPRCARHAVPRKMLGRRRGWMLLAQASSWSDCGIAFGDPAHALSWTIASAFLLAFVSASQDVVIDGCRIDSAPVERQGMMSAAAQLGYSGALLCAGAGALYIADFISWKAAYLSMAALMAVGIAAYSWRPQDGARPARPRRGPLASPPSFAEPIVDILRRKGGPARSRSCCSSRFTVCPISSPA